MTKIYISTKILSSTTVFNIFNNMIYFLSKKINKHIKMISEGSCDTEYCSNDAENFAIIGITYFLEIL